MSTDNDQDISEAVSPNPDIEFYLETAIDGDRDSATAFFLAVLAGPLFVPDRQQASPLSDAPQYPEEIFGLLGIQENERSVVPVFSDPAYIKDWCGNELSYRSTPGQKLFGIIPSDWWITLNPGSLIGKEFSPWEIQQLALGRDSIKEVVEENYSGEIAEPIGVAPLNEGTYCSLYSDLTDLASTLPELEKLYLLEEARAVLDEEERTVILIGAELSACVARDKVPELNQRIRTAAEQSLIGHDVELRIFCDTIANSPSLGLFQNTPAAYTRPQTETRLKRMLTRLVR